MAISANVFGFLLSLNLAITIVLLVLLSIHFNNSKEHSTSPVNTQTALTFSLPTNAMKISPDVYCVDDLDSGLVTYYYIRTETNILGRLNATRPANLGPCCESIIPGAIWKSTEPLELDTSNTQGLSSSFVHNSFLQAANKWQKTTSFDLFGAITLAPSSGINFNSRNQIGFGAITIPGAQTAVAVTAIFFICSRRDPPPNGPCVESSGIVETDMILNSAVHPFGNARTQSSVFDVLTTFLHELGHVFGLGDLLPPRNCEQSTMWGFISRGQVKDTIDSDSKKCVQSVGYPSALSKNRSTAEKTQITLGLILSLILFI